MAANKQPLVVIKKITIAAAAGHGGSWKVAFADFMTAMMAFFLVMWLLSQNEEVKKNVADYFSTPSIIEYNFSNYGVELTLEKLFLDLINEPLKFFQSFITPVDSTPNLMTMGSKKIVEAHLAEQLEDIASIEVFSDEIKIEILASEIFKESSGEPNSKFIEIMKKVEGITSGLEDVDIYVDSIVYTSSGERAEKIANALAQQRLDLVTTRVDSTLEHDTVDVFGKSNVRVIVSPKDSAEDVLEIRAKQKPTTSDGKPQRKLRDIFGAKAPAGVGSDGYSQREPANRLRDDSSANAKAATSLRDSSSEFPEGFSASEEDAVTLNPNEGASGNQKRVRVLDPRDLPRLPKESGRSGNRAVKPVGNLEQEFLDDVTNQLEGGKTVENGDRETAAEKDLPPKKELAPVETEDPEL